MRQAGYLAAAGIYALDHNIERLEEDHQNAKVLGNALSQFHFVKSVLPVETNIVMAELIDGYHVESFVDRMAHHGIKCAGFGQQLIRFVTHLDVTSEMITYTIDVMKKDRH